MNVNDVAGPAHRPINLMTDIFEQQHTLAKKYLDIEEKNGLLQTRDMPVNLQDPKGQARLKDMMWRTVEEIAEALEANSKNEEVHFMEELADALHFLVELCLLSGVVISDELYNTRMTRRGVTKWASTYYANEFVYKLGLAANCLKNKPWKVTHVMTDEFKYRGLIESAFIEFLELAITADFTAESLYDMYFRKHQVNVFRQETKY